MPVWLGIDGSWVWGVAVEGAPARGDPTGVSDSTGGGVSSSMPGGSGPGMAPLWGCVLLLPFRLALLARMDAVVFRPGEASAERPRTMPSSTSRFFASMAAFRLVSSANLVSSTASAALFVSRIFSNPSSSARRALMLCDTAPSALASDLRSALRRAACTGGVGVALLGSVSLSYSMSAVDDAPLEDIIAFETVICSGTSG